MTYSAYERELAREFIAETEHLDDPANQLAHLLADERRDARRQALEEAAKLADAAWAAARYGDLAYKIRALKDGAP